MADWLHQRLGRLEQRDTAMLHRCCDIEKKLAEVKCCHTFYYGEIVSVLKVAFGNRMKKINRPAGRESLRNCNQIKIH